VAKLTKLDLMAELLLELYSEEIPPQLQIEPEINLNNFLKIFLKKKALSVKKY
jgi:glycyl-tRNA synthetase beta subunit